MCVCGCECGLSSGVLVLFSISTNLSWGTWSRNKTIG